MYTYIHTYMHACMHTDREYWRNTFAMCQVRLWRECWVIGFLRTPISYSPSRNNQTRHVFPCGATIRG